MAWDFRCFKYRLWMFCQLIVGKSEWIPKMHAHSLSMEHAAHCLVASTSATSQLFLIYGSEGKWCKLVAIAMVELALELYPVKTQRMQEGRQGLHHHQHPEGCTRKYKEACTGWAQRIVSIGSGTLLMLLLETRVYRPAVGEEREKDSKAKTNACNT